MGDPLDEQLRLRAAWLREQGLDYALDREPPRARGKARPDGSYRAPETSAEGHILQASESPPIETVAGDPAERLRQIREEIGDCRRCRLCEGRKNVVFGVGDPAARVIFVGEGPGADEDRQGIPFVGRAGQLLTDIITKGMGLRREEVYIANIVKCRPPENREPMPDEAATCFPFLVAQIEAIAPQVIVGLGKTACQALCGGAVQITKFRGRWTDFRGIPLMPTFHPSYLLRNPAAKKEVWEDIQQVMVRVGLSVRKK